MWQLLATLALFPVITAQGLWVRRRVPRLLEPPGARRGEAGEGAPLRLLILGDSAAAGVGAPHQDQALAGRLVARLSRTHRVHWRLHARTGATTASTFDALGALGAAEFDVVVTSLGINDLTAGVRRSVWRRRQARLRRELRRRFSARYIVVSGLPPIEGFPALPEPLRWCLGVRARQFSRDLATDVVPDPACDFVDLGSIRDPALMASDGFHPGPGVYALWAERVAAVIVARSGRNQAA